MRSLLASVTPAVELGPDRVTLTPGISCGAIASVDKRSSPGGLVHLWRASRAPHMNLCARQPLSG